MAACSYGLYRMHGGRPARQVVSSEVSSLVSIVSESVDTSQHGDNFGRGVALGVLRGLTVLASRFSLDIFDLCKKFVSAAGRTNFEEAIDLVLSQPCD